MPRTTSALFAFLLATCALLPGCAMNDSVAANNVIDLNIRGSVHGGQQPISGATIQLY